MNYHILWCRRHCRRKITQRCLSEHVHGSYGGLGCSQSRVQCCNAVVVTLFNTLVIQFIHIYEFADLPYSLLHRMRVTSADVPRRVHAIDTENERAIEFFASTTADRCCVLFVRKVHTDIRYRDGIIACPAHPYNYRVRAGCAADVMAFKTKGRLYLVLLVQSVLTP